MPYDKEQAIATAVAYLNAVQVADFPCRAWMFRDVEGNWFRFRPGAAMRLGLELLLGRCSTDAYQDFVANVTPSRAPE